MRVLLGKVVSGVGDFARWIDELRDHYRRKTGLDLFPVRCFILWTPTSTFTFSRIQASKRKRVMTYVNTLACASCLYLQLFVRKRRCPTTKGKIIRVAIFDYGTTGKDQTWN